MKEVKTFSDLIEEMIITLIPYYTSSFMGLSTFERDKEKEIKRIKKRLDRMVKAKVYIETIKKEDKEN